MGEIFLMPDSYSFNLTVVMPAYNEEEAITEAVSDIQKYILDRIKNSNFIVVNDGSKDSTGKILDEIASQDPRIQVIHQKNGGHGNALINGLNSANGEYLFMIDSDRQIPIEAFDSLWQNIQGRDGVFGVRRVRHDAPVRLQLTKVLRGIISLLFGVKLYDGNVPFKIVKNDIWKTAYSIMAENTIMPSYLLAIYMFYKKFNVAEIDVPHKDRMTGVVSIRKWSLFKFCIKGIIQIIDFRGRIR